MRVISLASNYWTNHPGKLSTLAMLIIAIAVSWVNFNTHLWNQDGGVVKHDIMVYYSYLPAAIIYNDLSFSFVDDSPDYFGDKIYRHVAPNGGIYQKTTMGLSFLYLPFFLLGHMVAHLTGAEMTGYSPPYFFLLQFSSLFYLLLGLFFLRRILVMFFKDWVIALLFLSIVFATGVLFYSTFEAAMSHVYSFMLFSLFIWLSIKWHQKPSTFTTIWLGLTFGLIALIRPSNGLVVLFFILYNIKTMHEAGPRIRLFVRSWHQILLIIFLAVLVFTPQLFYWKFSTGQWFFYSYGDEKFFFLQPNILNGLFSYRKGWLLYTPIMIVALAGFYPLYKRYRQFFLAILVFTVLNIYVVYSWWDWWYGGGLGSRPMIDSYALMVIPLAAFITWISTRTWGKILAVIMVIIFGCHGIFQTMQYRYGALHYMAMTKKAYWHSFGRIRPKYPFYDYIEYPDIMQARKGIQAAALKSKQTFEAFITCNYEVLTDNGEFFYSTDKEFLLSGVGKRSDEHARSGIYSMMLYKQEQFGSDMLLKVEPGEGFRLSVWKYPARATGGVALTAPLEANYYNFSQVVSAEDEIGWGKVELEVKIPDTLSGLMKIYLWNPGKEKVYFDDLTIEKIAHKP